MSCRGKIGYFVEPGEGWRLWSFDRRGRLCREGACLKIDVQSLHMGVFCVALVVGVTVLVGNYPAEI